MAIKDERIKFWEEFAVKIEEAVKKRDYKTLKRYYKILLEWLENKTYITKNYD